MRPPRLRPGPRLLTAAVALLALVVASVLLLSETTPPQGRRLASFFEDDQLLVNPPLTRTGNATVAATLETLKSLGVDRIRVIVVWKRVDLATAAATTEPPGFDAADPGDYGTGWSPYDRIDDAAAADGIKVDFDLSAPAPAWAVTAQPAATTVPALPDADVYAPSAAYFEQFVHAAGRRYSGRYAPDGGTHDLPRVSFWSVWNEPNQPGWLSPQLDARTGDPAAPAMYRSLVDAFWSGLSATGHTPRSDTILIGELAPNGCVRGGPCAFTGLGTAYRPISPLPFLEDLYCVGPAAGTSLDSGSSSGSGSGFSSSSSSGPDADSGSDSGALRPLRGTAAAADGCPTHGDGATFVAAHPALFDSSGLSEHPYSFFLAPNVAFPLPDESGFAPLASLPKLESTLDGVFGADGDSRRLPLYLTEYGYVTNPPNPRYQVTPSAQALYLDQAEYIAAQDPRVRALSQFELQDTSPFQEGLEYRGGTPKPAFAAYRLPIFLPELESPTRVADPDTPVQVWGMLRPAANNTTQTAQIQWRASGVGSSGYRTLAMTTTRDPSGIISQDVVLPATGSVRLAWTAPGGSVIYSRTVAVTVR
jgi:hypothetical protein